MIARAAHDRPPLLLPDQDVHVLLAVAWAGPILTSQLVRLFGLPLTSRKLLRRLWSLEHHDLVRKQHYSRHDTANHAPRYMGYVWVATERAYPVLLGHEIEPPRHTPPPLHQVDHDVLATEVLVRAVELSRPVMSGVYFAREQYSTEHAARPRIDGIVMIRRGPLRPAHGALPWLTAKVAPEETDKCFAVEIDRGTEPYAVIFEKGIAYRTAAHTAAFRSHTGGFPTPLWVVPTAARLEGIIRHWRTAWPEGRWIITTEEDLHHDRWHLISDGSRTTRSLLEGW